MWLLFTVWPVPGPVLLIFHKSLVLCDISRHEPLYSERGHQEAGVLVGRGHKVLCYYVMRGILVMRVQIF